MSRLGSRVLLMTALFLFLASAGVGIWVLSSTNAPSPRRSSVPPTSRRPSSSPSPTEAPEHPPTQPDIYYIVLDEYSGERALAEHYGFDNRPFLDALRARGLFVAEHATTNYARTSMSLASALNLDYLQQLIQPVPADQSDPGPIDRLVQNDEVPRLLKARGYTYYHLGSWWSDTKTNPQADVNERMSSTEDEARKLGIALPAFRGGSRAKYYFDRAEYMRVLFQFAKLAELGDVAGPKFVFGHILCPHGPFVFDLAGGWVDQTVRATMSEDEDYIRQLQFVNSKVLTLVDRLLSLPPDRRPVIIIQSDEGWLSGSLAETNSPDSSLLVHFGIVAAFSFPGFSAPGLYATITPVNEFRLVFDDYFHAGLPLLPDRNYVFPNLRLRYTFTDVTDRVRALS